MFHNLSLDTLLIRVSNAVAAGTTAINTTAVDLQATNGIAVRWIAGFGALTATQVTSLKVQGSDDNSTWVDIAGSKSGPMADTDSNKMLVTDIYKPHHRYVRAVVQRATANAVVDFVLAEIYHLRSSPSTPDATVSARVVLNSPADGTP